MKQLTIKKKITLWYTGIIAVVLGTILVLVLLFVDKVGISATEEEIIAAVTGFSSNINFQDDSFYLDGDTEFYDDGIMFCIYDKNGRLLYGTIPTQFPEETILKSNTPRMITGSNRKWMIYDSVYTYGDDEEMWVRGITSVHSIELFMQTSEKMLLIVFPLLIILIGAIGLFIIKYICDMVGLKKSFVKAIPNLLIKYNSIFIIIASICLFCGMVGSTIKVGDKIEKQIIILSQASLGVYLLHENREFRMLLWNRIVNLKRFSEMPILFGGYIIVSAVVIFFIGIVCEMSRKSLMDLLKKRVKKNLSTVKFSFAKKVYGRKLKKMGMRFFDESK